MIAANRAGLLVESAGSLGNAAASIAASGSVLSRAEGMGRFLCVRSDAISERGRLVWASSAANSVATLEVRPGRLATRSIAQCAGIGAGRRCRVRLQLSGKGQVGVARGVFGAFTEALVQAGRNAVAIGQAANPCVVGLTEGFAVSAATQPVVGVQICLERRYGNLGLVAVVLAPFVEIVDDGEVRTERAVLLHREGDHVE